MSLFLATLLPSLLLLAVGGHILWHGARTEKLVKAFPRSTPAAYIAMGLASVWFLYNVLQLGEADFGQYRKLLFIVFAAGAIGSFYFVPDFLAVRGAAALILLCAHELLAAAYMQPQTTRLFLVSFVYLAIGAAIYLGASPYRLRDFFDWLYRSEPRVRVMGGAFSAYGLVLLAVAFTY